MNLPEEIVDAAAAAGVGLVAGLIGTAAMTVSSTLEARLRGRGSSTTPAAALKAILGVHPDDERAEQRLNNLAHWGYGTGWGAVRGVISRTGLRGAPAAGAHLAAIWGTEQVVLPATGAAGPAWTWEPKEIGIDLFHHVVYAVATSLAYDWLDSRRADAVLR